ncbi:YfjI family protein [Actinoallomurus spadix]|nr:DUF3987 domain-containing protein [Actinoallomurus spadix]MCO5989943.1 YfjI family protein [Actinoallomurus spadix]
MSKRREGHGMFHFLDGEEESRWGADPVLDAGSGEKAFRRWAEGVVAADPASLLATLRADRPIPGWAKVMFLDAEPAHAGFLDAAYRRRLERRASPTRPSAPEAVQADRPEPTRSGPGPVRTRQDERETVAAPASGWYTLERPGPLPDEAMFDGLPGRVVREIHPYTEGDPVGVLATLLSAFSAAAGRGPHVAIGSTRHPLLVWTMLIGRTALGRKGTATNAAMEIFERVSPEFTERHLLYGSPSSGAGLVGKLEAMAREAGWYEDGDPLDDEPEVRPGFPALMIEEEWAKVMRRSRIDDALGQNLRTAWQGNTLSVIVKRKADCATVKKAHVAIVGHITPDEFRGNLSAADVAGGTFNRFLPVFVQRCQSLPLADEMPEATADRLAGELRAAVTRARSVGRIGFDDAARAYWTDHLYDRLTGLSTGSELIESFAGRAVPYAKRIAALYALADEESSISRSHLRRAEAFVTYVIDSVEYIMATGTARTVRKGRPDAANPHLTRKVIEALVGAYPAPLSRSDLLAKIKNFGTSTDLDNSLASLDGDLQTSVSRAGSGRPTHLYRLTEAAATRLTPPAQRSPSDPHGQW